MCGLCGFAFAERQPPAGTAEIKKMTDALKHRGPDSEGFLTAPGIALGFRRLSIIDLNGGDQPILNEDETVAVVCNGEIYNFVELRQELQARGHRFRTRSDVETIVHLYEEHGPDCVRYLRGMFAFGLWDSRLKRLMLARDRLGIKPMHYALGPHRIDFASEQKAILAGDAVIDRRMDPQAIRDLLEFGFVLGAGTLVRGIRRLLPGSYLLYQQGYVSTHQYWDVSFDSRPGKQDPRTTEGWAEALHDKLRECVRMHMRSDVAVGVMLSPGIDSSAVAALACGFTREPIRSVTLAFDDPGLDETRRNPTLNQYPGFAITNEVVNCGAGEFGKFPSALWHCEEPTSVMIPRMILSQAAARGVKVVLTGEGADEVLGGYAWYKQEKLFAPFAHLPRWVRRLMLHATPLIRGWNHKMTDVFLAPPEMDFARYHAMLSPASGGTGEDLFAPALRRQLALLPDKLPIRLPDEFRRWNNFQKLQYLDLKIRLPEFVNHSLDRASMAFGLEARLPFLDHELVELCGRMPVSLKLNGLREKYILRKAMRNVLPAAIAARRKNGMGAPTRSWWRGPLPEFAAQALREKSLRQAEFFNPAAIQRILEMHQRGQKGFGDQLNAVLAVQLKFGSAMPAESTEHALP